MAVCNLFNTLSHETGNFLLFSQYVEDVTKGYPNGDNYKVVPSRFVALDIDYSSIDIPGYDRPNTHIPMYFQNIFENGCAYLRSKSGFDWTPEISRNLFWNNMFEGKFLTITEDADTSLISEVMYYGDINMHAYNEHKGMGYGEIYCYIPTNAKRMKCQVICNNELENRLFDDTNTSNKLLGHTTTIDTTVYPQKYYYAQDFRMSFDDSEIESLIPYDDSKYSINTIVLLYSIYAKENDTWRPVYENLPMGMYFTGMLENSKMTNTVTKYVTTDYGSGTSYGLRLCTRFSAMPNGAVLSTSDITVDDSNYANMCQLMTAMNENLSAMLDVTKSVINTTQEYKETLAIIKNNRTNVPYVREVNGKDFWFVNGRMVSAVDGSDQCCVEYSPETIKKRLDNLADNDPTNDYTPIIDINGCSCEEYKVRELAEELGLDPENYPEELI